MASTLILEAPDEIRRNLRMVQFCTMPPIARLSAHYAHERERCVITDKGDMLSLTDMWKAAGSDPIKAPAQWQRLSSAEDFIGHVSIIVGKSHNNLIETRRRAGTFAHWQIGMAYAKYLDHDFHMWCNRLDFIQSVHRNWRAACFMPSASFAPHCPAASVPKLFQ
ncbi:KilA-N domain-containing protein [Agrobacterium tumefaciens]|nr:KilA-N domain-containing protein [Agrobacterium tumefaciens]NSZ40180.1 KilA-N domain-containing protein [Agrobacterium tumefaciens]NTB22809.1 KilA-N domain-containing protein [Agrobacterium tumefaciens]NTB29319.1 KilA-N domain-containing protein [Agrobacterium tumefaciens]NTB33185.1 KilA-N domain-containing protein [Agrobacterium tumefaciens]